MGLGGAYWAGVGALAGRRGVSRRACPTCRPLPSAGDATTGAAVRAPATLRSIGAGHARIFLTVGIGVLLVWRCAPRARR